MPQPRFSIGIDLGTTNSALSFAPLAGDAALEILAVSQWESPTSLVDSLTLPSFLYLPEDAVAAQLRGHRSGAGDWIVGRLARAKAGEVPGRVILSAKSWLCHHAADRLSPFLPWGSTDLAPEQKISPVRASALVLNYLRGAWNDRFAAAGAAFDDQTVTLTVPASFDAAAQRLTLAAAAEAGFPEGVRLLEEPQAAFYCWLERNDAGAAPWPDGDAGEAGPRHVLVVDIGGGTSDFSLFALHKTSRDAIADVRRVAVSDHILLGGDNVDRALAFLVEQRLGGGRGTVSGTQWDRLVATCRDLKEQALSGTGAPDETFVVAVAGRGSGLVAASKTVTLTRADIEGVLLDGFFPDCDARARPYRAAGGLRELGLPYATDSAVTRHLADFLRDMPRVDAVLFNGGSMHPARLRDRVRDQIAAWRDGAAPLVLANAEPDLAVARGAARYGALLHRDARHIAAGAPRAVFLEVGRAGGENAALVCVLPRGAAPEQIFEISDPSLALTTDVPVRFRAFSSTRHGGARAGDILPLQEEHFGALPPLQTIARTDSPGDGKTVPVHLTARMNALGLLQIACVSNDPAIAKSWPLEFNLRPGDFSAAPTTPDGAAPLEPNAAPAALAAARQRLAAVFGAPPKKPERIAASGLLKNLESLLAAPRNAWNAALLRALWPALADRLDGRRISVDHEEAWITIAGFLLRPGFGVAGDSLRMDSLWRLHATGACFPGRRIKTQEYILWRRVAGGLSRDRQEILLAGEMEKLRAGKAPPELVRLVGSLELISRDLKKELVERFIEAAVGLARANGHCGPYLAALGLLLNRAPFHAGPETVLPPDLVEAAYAALRGFDWADADLLEAQTLFLRAARVVDDRGLDVPKPLRNLIAGKLEKAGVPATRTARIKDFVPVGRADRASLYDEALPPGLILGL